jgi:hypothetical protein|tara:strand:+ start:1672 stop:2163 length:492 start_codon:yes stop_codon:yes gene_type:complete
MGKDKWEYLIRYLETTNAKPESVLNLVKNTWKPKGKSKVKTDDFNIVRRAWTLMVVHGIYNKHGTPKNKIKTVSITNQILYFVESQGFKINYNLFHPIKDKNKTEWIENNDNPYSKKTISQHAKNCRKLWDSAKGKEIRKGLKNSKGKIPITFKGELNPLFDL